MGEKSLQSVYFCRICLEEELQHSHKLEAPCACSGTSKFAHRECIQKWCYEKGNTTCEICLQKFLPGYSVVLPPPPPSPPPREINRMIEAMITREFPNFNWDGVNVEIPIESQEEEILEELFGTEFPDSTDDQTPSCCKLVFLIFIVLILVKHIFIVLTGGWRLLNGFGHFMVIVVRTFGYIIPMYIIIWIMILIEKYQQSQRRSSNNNIDDEDEQPLRIRVDR